MDRKIYYWNHLEIVRLLKDVMSGNGTKKKSIQLTKELVIIFGHAVED